MGAKKDQINTLENRVFRLNCEIEKLRMFRKVVEDLVQNRTTFGTVTEAEWKELDKELESIKYY